MLKFWVSLFFIVGVSDASAQHCGVHTRNLAARSDESHVSRGRIGIVEGESINLWAYNDSVSPGESSQQELQLSPDRPVVIGRLEGTQPPYLDKRYRPTQMMPNTGTKVTSGSILDNRLSRAHLMLKSSTRGIVLMNGVPREGGGVRSPTNGTQLLAPENRPMKPGEELLIESGTSAKVELPNGTVLLINAD